MTNRFTCAKGRSRWYSETVRLLRSTAAVSDAVGRGVATTATQNIRCHINNAREISHDQPCRYFTLYIKITVTDVELFPVIYYCLSVDQKLMGRGAPRGSRILQGPRELAASVVFPASTWFLLKR